MESDFVWVIQDEETDVIFVIKDLETIQQKLEVFYEEKLSNLEIKWFEDSTIQISFYWEFDDGANYVFGEKFEIC